MQKKLLAFLSVILVCLTTFAYSALSTSLAITSEVKFRPLADIRINSIGLNGATGGATIQYESEYSRNTISNGFVLPSANSSISYTVHIDNSGDLDYSIYDILTTSSNNQGLIVNISGYNMRDIIPAKTSLDVVVTYTTTNPGASVINVVNTFDFRKVFRVSYNTTGSSTTIPQQIKYEGVDLTLSSTVPTKNGYTFSKWNTKQDGTGVNYNSGATYTVDEDKILYARWNLATYNITYVLDGGTNGNNPSTYTIESSNITLADATKANYVFKGWTGNGTTTPTKNLVLPQGSYGDKEFTAVFKDETDPEIAVTNSDGTTNYLESTYTINISYGATSANATVYINATDAASGIKKIEYVYTTDTTVPTTGWTEISNGQLKVNKNFGTYYLHVRATDNENNVTTVTTKQVRLRYRIAYYDDYSASTSASQTVNYYYGGAAVTTRNPSKTGYTFDGWYSDTALTTKEVNGNASYTPTKSIRLYGKWNINTYTIGYTLNGGTVSGTNPTSYNVESSAITLINPTKTGYTFKGWSGTELTGNTNQTVTIAAGSTGNRSYTANWTANQYQLTISGNGGTIPATTGWTVATGSISATKQVTYDSTYGTMPTPTWTGYTFKGWFTDPTGGTEVKGTDTVNITSDTTLYAHWADETKPSNASITSTNNVASSQTATLSCSDGVGVTSYYWGTTAPTDSSTYTDITSTTSMSINKTVNASGTYYLVCKDAAGNKSDTVSKVFYKTTLNMTNGTVTPASVITMTGNSFNLPTPTATTGYTAKGLWYTNSGMTTGAKAYGASYTPSSNAILYSGATINKYNVEVVVNHGTGSATKEVNYGSTETFAIGADTGYENPTVSCTNSQTATISGTTLTTGTITDNTVCTVTYVAKTYTLTINPQGGSYNSTTSNSTKTMTFDASTNNDIGTPTRNGYTFAGWYTQANGGTQLYGTNGRNVAANGYWSAGYSSGVWKKDADVTVYAKWTKTVTATTNTLSETNFIYNGNAQGPTVTVKDGNTTLTAGTDYTVSGNSNTDVGEYTITITGKSVYNSTTKAYYTGTTTLTYYINNAKITYDANSCGTISGTNPAYVKKNATGVYTTIRGTAAGTIASISKNGYTFNGWYDGNTKVINANGTVVASVSNWTDSNSKWLITEDKTLTASCSRDSYSINYAMNNGTNNANNPSSYNVESSAITLVAPTKTLTFKGNYNATSGANASSTSGVSLGSNTTKAQTFAGWTGSNGSTAQTSVTIAAGSTGNKSYTAHWTAVAGTLPTVTRTGYTCGWSTSSSATTATYESGGTFPTSAITEGMSATVNLYAVCTPNTYTIAYTMNGGTSGTSAPTTGTFDSNVTINKPSKTFTVNINANGQNATIKNAGGTAVTSASSIQEFAGWTANSNLNTTTAKYGSSSSAVTSSWSNGSTKVGASADPMYFKNLRSESGTVTLTANWTAVNVTLPNISKTGYTCGYATSAGGDIVYNSGDSYTPSTTTNSATLFAKCNPNTYTIAYTLNNGNNPSTKPTSGTYDADVIISNPTKTVTVTPNVNGTSATVGSATSKAQTFAGWSSTTIGSNAQTKAASGSYAAWNGTTKTTNTYFKNLRETGTVTMVANWTAKAVTLPTLTSPAGYTCKYYTASTGGTEMGAGGASWTPTANGNQAITAYVRCAERDDTAYTVNHYVHDIGANTYTLNSTDNLTGRTGATLTLANLKKTITGATYVEGHLTGNTTKPTTTPVTTTTIAADGSRVINLYYRRNYLYVQYHVNTGSLSSSHGTGIGTSGSLITYTSNETSTNFLEGVYGGKVGSSVNTDTYVIENNGLWNYNNSAAINIVKTGYIAKSAAQWNSSADGTGTDYNQDTKTYDANGFAGADLTTGDKVVTVYVNWVPQNYSITYTMNNGTNNANNPSGYNIESSAISLTAPTKTLTFKGNYNATTGANASSTSGVSLGSNTTKAQTFAGWTGSNGSTAQTSVTIATGSTGNKTYTAHWTAVAGNTPTVTRTGYTCGWNRSSTGTTIEINSGAQFPTSYITEGMSATVNLYAVCLPKTYTLTINPQGGTYDSKTTNSTKTMTYDSSDNNDIGIPTRSGYTFDGWYIEANSKTNKLFDNTGKNTNLSGYFSAAYSTGVWKKDANVTVYAHWSKAVTATTNSVSPTSYIYDGTAKTPTPTVKDGSTTLTSGTDYTISYTNNTNVGTATATITGKNVYNSTTKAYYTGTTTINFAINNAKLTFNKGTCDATSGTTTLYTKKGATGVYTEIQNSTAGTIPTASKTGYTFQGWYNANSGGSKVLNANGSFTGTGVTNYTNATSWQTVANQTLYAVCTPNTYQITYDYNADNTTVGNDYYIDTGYKIDWDRDFKLNSTINFPTLSQRYLLFGNYNSTSELNLELYTNKLRAYSNGELGTSTGTVAASTDIQIEFAYTASNKEFTYTSTGTNSNASVSGTNDKSGSGSATLRIGTDSRTNNTFKTYTLKNASITDYYLYDTKLTRLPTAPIKTGYTFDGWYTAASSGTRVTTDTDVPAANTTYYAHWSINNPATPTITGGETKVYGAKATTLTCSTATNYTGATKYYSFGYATSNGGTPSNWTTASTSNTLSVGAEEYIGQRWYSCRVYASDGDQTTSTVASATTADTEMTINNAKITWDTNSCGTISGTSPAYVKKGTTGVYTGIRNTTAGTIASVSKSGYTFNGWYDGTTKVINANGTIVASVSNWTDANSKWLITADKTLKASCTRNSYTITYTLNNGTVSPANPTTYNVESSAITLNNPTKTLTFKGNYNATSGANAASGSGVTIGSNTTKAQTFAGWSGTGITGNSTSVTIAAGSTGNRSYTAHWTAVAPAKLPKVTRTGYTCGWNTSSTGTTIEYASEATNYPTSKITEDISATVNLYAVCTPNIYSVALDNQSATTAGTTKVWYKYKTSSGSCYYYTDSTLTTCLTSSAITKPTKTGYAFGGYYTGTNGSGTNYVNSSGTFINNIYQTVPSDINSNYTDETTLYAKWTANTYTIGYTMNSGPNPTTKPTSGTYDSDVVISNPGNKTVTITGNVNNSGATIGSATTGTQTFSGWTSTTVGSNAKTGNAANPTTAWTGGSTKNTYFKNLRESGTVTMVANWSGTATLPTVTKTGYTCKWYDASGTSGGNLIGTSGGTWTMPSTTATSVTLYARCTVNQYTLTINPNGGTWNNKTTNTTVTQDYGTTYNVLNNATKTGYIFAGWKLTTGNGDVTYFQDSEKVNQYIINSTSANKPGMYNNKGNGTVTHTIQADSTSSTGYSMKITTNGEAAPGAGGFVNSNNAVGGAIYYHKIVAKVPVGYNLNIASNTMGVGYGYYWITSQAGTGNWQTYIYATYSGYNGPFSSFGHVYASGSNNQSVTWYINESTMYRKGSNLSETQASNLIFGFLDSDATLTAQWSASGVTVTWKTQNGTLGNGTVGTKWGATYAYRYLTQYNDTKKAPYYISDSDFGIYRNGYTFNGWYTAATGGTQIFDASGQLNASVSGYSDADKKWQKYDANVDLYARWTANTYTVSFNNNGGSGGQSADVTATYDSAMPTISTTAPTKTGYTFKGWYDTSAATGGTQYYTAAGASARTWNKTENTTLYARWADETKPTPTITGGTGLKQTSQSVTIKCSDGVGVTAYSWGTTAPTAATDITTTTDLSTVTGAGLSKTGLTNGTYYLGCRDAAGNFEKTSITIRKYQVQNVLEKIAGARGTYKSANYESTGTAATYYVKQGTSLTLASIYTAPTGAGASGTFLGYTTSAPSTTAQTPSNTAPSAPANDTTVYYMWWNRNTYTVTITKHAKGATTASTNGQTGNTETVAAGASNNGSLTVKYGDTVTATATPSTGYHFDSWSGYVTGSTNPATGAAITSNQTITPSFTGNTYTATFKYYDGTQLATTTSQCTVTSGSSCAVEVPTEVSTSTGQYGSTYVNVSRSTSNLTAGSLTMTEDATFYAYYSSPVTIYYPIATVDSTTGALSNTSVGSYSYYRNEFYNSASAMTAVINSTQTATTNFTFTPSATGYALRGFANAANSTTRNHNGVANLAVTNKTTAYAIIRKGITATVYYNSGSGNGTLTVATATTATAYRTMYCGTTTTIKMSNASYEIPAAVSASVGQYGNKFYELAQATSSMAVNRRTSTTSTATGADTKYLYAIYQGNEVEGTKTDVTNYYYDGSSYASRTLYRNSYFTSVSGNGAMSTVLATAASGTANYTTAVGPGSSVWTGLSTAQDTTTEYSTVAAAAISSDLTLYTVYTMNIAYEKGTNTNAIGKTSDSCKITTSSTACNVTLPSITPNTGYNAAGWSTTKDATTGTAAGQTYSNSSNTTKLYGNVVAKTYTLTINPQGGTYSGSTNNATKEMTYNATTNNDIGTPTRTGYTFNGWYTQANGGTQVYGSNGRNVNASTYWTAAYSSGKWKYDGDLTVYAHWSKDVSSLTNSVSPTSYIYSGNANSPTPTVKDGSTTLTSGTDYTVSYTNNTNVGTATATITGANVYNSTTKAYYTGTATVNYAINNAKLTFNKGTCSSVSGTATLYTKKNATKVYTTIQGTTEGTIPTGTPATGYTFQGWYNASSGGSKVLNANGSFTGEAVTNYTNATSWQTVANQTLYARCTDVDDPTATITGGTSLGQISQSVTIKCSDTAGVTAYYFGTSNPALADITDTTSLASVTGAGLSKTGLTNNTYYLGCRDAAGNVDVTSIKIINYRVRCVIEKIEGTRGTYTSDNYENQDPGGGSTISNYVKAGTPITQNYRYCNYDTSGNSEYLGYTTTEPTTTPATLTTSDPAPTDDIIYYAWQNRKTRTVTVTKHANGGTTATTNGQVGNTVTVAAGASANGSLTVKYGDTVTATATPSTGYHFDSWSGYVTGSNNPATGAAITSNQTITPTYSLNTYTVEYYQGNNSTTAGSTKFATTSSHTYGTAKNLTTYETLGGTAPTGWTFAGWSTTQDGTAVSTAGGSLLTDGASVTNLTSEHNATVKLYAVFSKDFTVLSGENGATSATVTQYYNPYKTNKVTSITLPEQTGILGWESTGYRSDTTAAAAMSSSTIAPPYNAEYTTFYAIYTRIIRCHSGINQATTTDKTQYLNTYNNTVSSVKLSSPASISSWTKSGWRTDTTSTSREYTTTATITPEYSNTNYIHLYAIYIRTAAAKYYSGQNKATNYTQTITRYYNTAEGATLPTTATYTLYSSSYAQSINRWYSNGWRDDTEDGNKEYSFGQENQTITLGTTVNYYAVYFIYMDIRYYGGNTPSMLGTSRFYKYYNTNTETLSRDINFTLMDNPTSSNANITNWTKEGWAWNTTAATSTPLDFGYSGQYPQSSSYYYYTVNIYLVYSRTYYIRYSSNGGSGTMTNSTTTVYLNSANKSMTPQEVTLRGNMYTKTGNTFRSWKIGSTEYNPGDTYTGNLAYNDAWFYEYAYAQWDIDSHTVTYNCTQNGGSGTVADGTVDYGDSVDLTPTCTPPSGFTHIGWNTSSTATSALSSLNMGTSNVTLYAIYKSSAQYTGTFTVQDTAAVSAPSQATTTVSCYRYNNGSSCSITAPTLTANSGYTASGWKLNGTAASTTADVASGASISLNGNKSYASVTKQNTAVSVAFNKNTASSISTPSGCSASGNTVTCTCTRWNGQGCSITSPSITAPTGKHGVGFNTSSSATTSTWNVSTAKTLTANATYHAITAYNTYSIAFNRNCPSGSTGSGTMSNQSMTYGTAANLTANAYKCSGYIFDKWTTAANGTGTAYTDGQSVNNLTTTNNGTYTIYAQWKQVWAENLAYNNSNTGVACSDAQCMIDKLWELLNP